ncbi:hypothetical protein VTI28DRAFT_4762 [Corynascus sepedonium]
MVGSALALSLIGLSAVHALPAGKAIEKRQVWLWPGTGDFHPGDGEPQPCFTDIPLQEQPPCILQPPIVGPITPSTKRDVEKRQVWLWPGTGEIRPGDGDPKPCLIGFPLREQPPCLLPPITGPIEPSTKREVNKRQILWPGTGEIHPGDGEPKPCLTGVPLHEQPPCILPPITGPIEPSTKREVNKRQVIWPGTSGDFQPGDGEELEPCLTDVPLQEQGPCILPPIVGGIDPSTRKRGFVLPPDFSTNPTKVIAQLKKELARLQNKPKKTKEDLADIEAIKAALKFLATLT